MALKRVWQTAGIALVVVTGMALWALLQEDQGPLERTEGELERLRSLGTA